MAGHSKWANIKRQREARVDAVKGKTFTSCRNHRSGSKWSARSSRQFFNCGRRLEKRGSWDTK